MSSVTVAALYVDGAGVYANLPGVEVWDEARDARRYAGPWPVVAHPPCARRWERGRRLGEPGFWSSERNSGRRAATRSVFRRGDAVRVAEAWGFEDCGEVVWGLRNPGIGSRTFANDHEPVLVARRGRPRIEGDDPLGVWFWRQVYEYGPAGVPQKKHSAKPPGFLEFVEQRCDGPYLELFAREARLGWDTWGDEALNHVSLTTAHVAVGDCASGAAR